MTSETMEIPRVALDAERAVIGSMLIGRKAVGKAMDMLSPKDFHSDAHKAAFEAAGLVAVKSGGLGVDIVTVSEELRRIGKMEDVGGAQYLKECMDTVATSDHVEHYARLVKQASIDRQIGDQLSRTSQDKTPENVSKLADLMAAMSAVHRAALFDFRKDLPEAVEKILSDRTSILKTNITRLDKAIGALRQGDIFTIGARTGGGKTAMLTRLAMSFAEQGIPTLYVTTEMSDADMLGRIFPMSTRIEAWRFRARRFEPQQEVALREAAKGQLAELPLTILGKPRVGLGDIRGAILDSGAKVVLVDYLQRCQMPKADSFAYSVGRFMADLKTLAQDMGRVVFIGCQLSRQMDKTATTPPNLSDLKDSGGIEAESDIVGLLWRPPAEQLANRENKVGPDMIGIDFIIAKHRHGKAGVSVELELDEKFVRIEDGTEAKPTNQKEFVPWTPPADQLKVDGKVPSHGWARIEKMAGDAYVKEKDEDPFNDYEN